MDAKQRAKWERWRRLGKRRYVLLLTLLYGIAYLVVVPIVSVVLFHEPFDMEIVVGALIFALTTGPIMGLFWWNIGERAYQDSTSREASQTD